MSTTALPGWDRLRHGGLLLDPPRLQQIARPRDDALRHLQLELGVLGAVVLAPLLWLCV